MVSFPAPPHGLSECIFKKECYIVTGRYRRTHLAVRRTFRQLCAHNKGEIVQAAAGTGMATIAVASQTSRADVQNPSRHSAQTYRSLQDA